MKPTSFYRILGAFAIAIMAVALYFFVDAQNQTQESTKNQNETEISKTETETETDAIDSASSDSPQMHHAPITSDRDFIVGMIPHHQEAVDTSTFLLTRTTDPEMKVFLQNVIDAQTKEIEMMKEWHREWFNSEYVDAGEYMEMMPDLRAIKDDHEAQDAYVSGMIEHHEGAIMMAEEIQEITDREELRTFADTIISVQKDEIEQMESFLDHEGHTIESSEHEMH